MAKKKTETKPANPVGRPKITLADLPEGWKEKMLELSKDGHSAVGLRVNALGGICHETWTRLIKEHDEFSEAVKRCQSLCEEWWENRGLEMAQGKDGNATVWIFNMKNRFNWRDKQELEHTGKDGGPIELTDRTERISRLAFLLGRGKSGGTGSDSSS